SHCRLSPIFTLFPYTTLFRSRSVTHALERLGLGEMALQWIAAGAIARPFITGADVLRLPENLECCFPRVGLGFRLLHFRSRARGDRKSTRLNSSHVSISYAVF